MKILQLCSYYPSSSLYRHLFTSLDLLGLKQTVYIPVDSEQLLNKSDQNYLESGELIVVKAFRKNDKFIYPYKIAKIYRDLVDRFNINSFDLVHAHSLFINGGVALKLKEKYGINYMVVVRSTDLNVFFNKALFLRKHGLRILRNAQRIVFLSPSYREALFSRFVPQAIEKELLQKTVVIPNGLDQFWIDNKYLPKRLPGKDIKLLFVGRFIKRKRLELCIETTKLLRKRGYNASILLIGGGSMQKTLFKLQKRNNTFVTVISWVRDKSELLTLYRQADIFIMPSRGETFGLVYLEAMSQGLPVIYAKNEGFDGFHKDGEVGYAVKSNAEEIADKIVNAVTNYKKISGNCYEVVNNYNWSRIASQYHRVYDVFKEYAGNKE